MAIRREPFIVHCCLRLPGDGKKHGSRLISRGKYISPLSPPCPPLTQYMWRRRLRDSPVKRRDSPPCNMLTGIFDATAVAGPFKRFSFFGAIDCGNRGIHRDPHFASAGGST